jgi:hypothetical protein
MQRQNVYDGTEVAGGYARAVTSGSPHPRLRHDLEAMGGNTPASSLIGTNALLKPELLIESEAYAILADEA